MAMESRRLAEGQHPSDIGPLYIIYFSGSHTNFRLAEFRAAADYLDTAYCFAPLPCNRIPWHDSVPEGVRLWTEPIELSLDTEDARRGLNIERPFMLVYLPNDDIVRQLCQRVTCIRSVWQQWTSACNVEEVHRQLASEDVKKLWFPYWGKSVSWRANVMGAQRSLNMTEQVDRMEMFKDTLDFQGPIKLKNADMEWGYMEEWTVPGLLPLEEEEAEGGRGKLLDLSKYEVEGGIDRRKNKRFQRQRLLCIHVGKKVADGTAREMVAKMDVKKRKYIGTTTMEAQMSLISAGMALSGPGKLVFDPFAGTCSLLLAAAALGAHVMASDIDGRMMRGKVDDGREVAVLGSARQYGVQDHFIDFVCSDISQHPWRGKGLFDAIVADPPYGVRAGAKQLGRRDVSKQRDEAYLLDDGTYSHQRDDYVPPTKPYALDDLLLDLMNFSANLLAPKGRLVFWMPTMTESAGDGAGDGQQRGMMQELQLELTPDFALVAHSLQDFGFWGRRLITLEKIPRGKIQQGKTSAVLPSPPPRHHGGSERLRATDDPNEFRNRFYTRKP